MVTREFEEKCIRRLKEYIRLFRPEEAIKQVSIFESHYFIQYISGNFETLYFSDFYYNSALKEVK